VVQRRSLLRAGVGAVASLGVGAGVLVTCASCATVADAVTRERAATDGVVHIGNSTHLVVLDGVHVLTDPWVRDPAEGILRHTVVPAPLPTHVDVVLITHEHEDHFDPVALAKLDKRATLVVPSWLEERAKPLGFAKLYAVRAGDVLNDVHGMRVDVVQAMHDVDELAFRFERSGRSVFFGGDTLPTLQIEALAARAPVDFAILPGNGGSLLGTRYVMDAPEAIAMARAFGVAADARRGAMLSHHEYVVSPQFPWALIVDVPAPDLVAFPPWFRVPSPGARISFPWMNT
jgi:L-ascorbate metabolism protein UlaG (beta-lactamase superfamily)